MPETPVDRITLPNSACAKLDAKELFHGAVNIT